MYLLWCASAADPSSLPPFVRPALTGDVWQLTGGGGGERRRRIQHTHWPQSEEEEAALLSLSAASLSFFLSLFCFPSHYCVRTEAMCTSLSLFLFLCGLAASASEDAHAASFSLSVSAAKAGASAATHRKVVPSPFRRPE